MEEKKKSHTATEPRNDLAHSHVDVEDRRVGASRTGRVTALNIVLMGLLLYSTSDRRGHVSELWTQEDAHQLQPTSPPNTKLHKSRTPQHSDSRTFTFTDD